MFFLRKSQNKAFCHYKCNLDLLISSYIFNIKFTKVMFFYFRNIFYPHLMECKIVLTVKFIECFLSTPYKQFLQCGFCILVAA